MEKFIESLGIVANIPGVAHHLLCLGMGLLFEPGTPFHLENNPCQQKPFQWVLRRCWHRAPAVLESELEWQGNKMPATETHFIENDIGGSADGIAWWLRAKFGNGVWCEGALWAPGWLSRLDIWLPVSAQVMISYFVRSSPTSGLGIPSLWPSPTCHTLATLSPK